MTKAMQPPTMLTVDDVVTVDGNAYVRIGGQQLPGQVPSIASPIDWHVPGISAWIREQA